MDHHAGRQTDEKLEHIVEMLQKINVNVERLRVSLLVVDQTVIDHENRVRVVERWKHQVTPILAALTFTLGAIVSMTVQRIF